MSTAQLRRSYRAGRTREYGFGPGRLERLTLSVWRMPRTEGQVYKARLTGRAYVACGMGNEHYPEIRIEHTENDEGLIALAWGGNNEAAALVAEELEGWALEDWFDPCDEEAA